LAIGFHLGSDFIIAVHRAKQCPGPLWQVDFGEDCIYGGETHHVKDFCLVQKGHCSVLLAGVDKVDDHLDIDVFSTISSWDEPLLVVANLFG
jgi:hypothetical protein